MGSVAEPFRWVFPSPALRRYPKDEAKGSVCVCVCVEGEKGGMGRTFSTLGTDTLRGRERPAA